MHEVHVRLAIAAPPERVFAVVADHARFLTDDATRCVVDRPGRDVRDGVGALRRVDAGRLRFVEEITRFEPPRRLDYVIRSVTFAGLPLPLRHEVGWLELHDDGDGTVVDWRTRFAVAVPVVGRAAEASLGRSLAAAFRSKLERARRELVGTG